MTNTKASLQHKIEMWQIRRGHTRTQDPYAHERKPCLGYQEAPNDGENAKHGHQLLASASCLRTSRDVLEEIAGKAKA